jgi:hypothetical protein
LAKRFLPAKSQDSQRIVPFQLAPTDKEDEPTESWNYSGIVCATGERLWWHRQGTDQESYVSCFIRAMAKEKEIKD